MAVKFNFEVRFDSLQPPILCLQTEKVKIYVNCGCASKNPRGTACGYINNYVMQSTEIVNFDQGQASTSTENRHVKVKGQSEKTR